MENKDNWIIDKISQDHIELRKEIKEVHHSIDELILMVGAVRNQKGYQSPSSIKKDDCWSWSQLYIWTFHLILFVISVWVSICFICYWLKKLSAFLK